MPGSPPRPRCSVFIAASLDGYIARTDGSIDWLSSVQLDGEDYGYQRFIDSVDAVVMGRKTYEVAAGFEPWPHAGRRCVVFTHQALAAKHGETFFQGTPAELTEQLSREGMKHVYVDGGTVIQQFLAARLIDQLTVSVIPVLLGGGSRLFPGTIPEQRLTLIESRSWSSGLTQVRYRLGAA